MTSGGHLFLLDLLKKKNPQDDSVRYICHIIITQYNNMYEGGR